MKTVGNQCACLSQQGRFPLARPTTGEGCRQPVGVWNTVANRPVSPMEQFSNGSADLQRSPFDLTVWLLTTLNRRLAVATRSISIYLLKQERSVDDTLEEDHDYKEVTPGSSSPTGTRLFVRGGKSKPPWWKEYFGIAEELWQQSSSGVAFVPIEERTFALAFGTGHYLLKPEAFDHDFGTRVALNAVDSKKLKSTDWTPTRRSDGGRSYPSMQTLPY